MTPAGCLRRARRALTMLSQSSTFGRHVAVVGLQLEGDLAGASEKPTNRAVEMYRECGTVGWMMTRKGDPAST